MLTTIVAFLTAQLYPELCLILSVSIGGSFILLGGFLRLFWLAALAALGAVVVIFVSLLMVTYADLSMVDRNIWNLTAISNVICLGISFAMGEHLSAPAEDEN